jgi:hypothetical protein
MYRKNGDPGAMFEVQFICQSSNRFQKNKALQDAVKKLKYVSGFSRIHAMLLVQKISSLCILGEETFHDILFCVN